MLFFYSHYIKIAIFCTIYNRTAFKQIIMLQVKLNTSNITKNVGHTSQFLFGIYWWTWKQLSKTCWSGSIKKWNNFNIYNIVFKKKFFLSFYPPTIKILKKWKQYLEMPSFHTCVPQMTIMWCMVSELWSTTDRIFVIFSYFLPFYPTNNLKNQNFEKIEKMPGDIIILHLCTTNDNHMMYGAWYMDCGRQNF